MEWQQLSAVVVFAFVSTFTPGPNNLMLMASGANAGFRRTIPHIMGISLGFSFMLLVVGLGLNSVFHQYPITHVVLKYLSLAYLCYLAFRIAMSGQSKTKHDYQPLSFFGAASFQWVNPKGWSMAMMAITVYSISHSWQELLLIAAIFCIVNLPSASFWTIAGMQLQRWLTTPKRVRSFNYLMAAALLVSTMPML
ncbi:LysE family translocator [Vibrio sp. TRT 17S01]|uniref:LysE family translocator n=1 Tax=Vibrio sp. TRT 17S01 TaxID=3418505 RepID=UPI003CF8F37A